MNTRNAANNKLFLDILSSTKSVPLASASQKNSEQSETAPALHPLSIQKSKSVSKRDSPASLAPAKSMKGIASQNASQKETSQVHSNHVQRVDPEGFGRSMLQNIYGGGK
jgi:hypothetical protein